MAVALRGMLVDNADKDHGSKDYNADNRREQRYYSGDKTDARDEVGNEAPTAEQPKILTKKNADHASSSVGEHEETAYYKGTIHCPDCGGTNLQIITETTTSNSTTGGGYSGGKACLGVMLLGPLGLLCGSCGNKSKTTTTNATTNYFVCKSCGKKFRVPDEIRTVSEKMRESIHGLKTLMLALVAIAAVITVIDVCITQGELLWVAGATWLSLISIGIAIVTTNSRAEQLKNEYAALIEKCKD